MNCDTLRGNWNQMKGRVKERWGRFTDDEVDMIEGRLDQLVGKIQERYGRTRDEAEREVKEFCERCKLPVAKGAKGDRHLARRSSRYQ